MVERVNTDDAYASTNANSQAVRHGDTIYVSGQVPKDAATGDVVGDDVVAQTAQVFRNLEAILAAADATLDDLVETRVYLQSVDDYDAFNDAYRQFVSEPYPARTTVEAGNLAVPVLVEISAVAALETDSESDRA
jgi:2-iminobutanoate/2-iminopropanoate deaminase